VSDHWLGSKNLSGDPLTLRMCDIGRENLVLELGRKDLVLELGRKDLVLELGRENLILELGRSFLGGLLNIPFNSCRSIFFEYLDSMRPVLSVACGAGVVAARFSWDSIAFV
jgi:hypothetical protein